MGQSPNTKPRAAPPGGAALDHDAISRIIADEDSTTSPGPKSISATSPGWGYGAWAAFRLREGDDPSSVNAARLDGPWLEWLGVCRTLNGTDRRSAFDIWIRKHPRGNELLAQVLAVPANLVEYPKLDPGHALEHFDAFLKSLPPGLQSMYRAQHVDIITEYSKGDPSAASLLPPLRLIKSDELLARQFKPLTWVVPNYLPAGLTILAGRPKVGKSWLALQICQAVATGGKVFGQDMVRSRVLYLALEDHARRLQERMNMQGWPAGTTGADFMLADAFREQIQELNGGGGVRLAKHIRDQGYGFVVIDTFSRALKGDQKDESEMTAALAPLQEEALKLEISVLVIDHHKKPMGNLDPNPVDDILGSTAKGAVADAVWGLYKEQGKRGAKLAINGRDISEQTLKMFFDNELRCWQCEGDAFEIELTDRRKEILDAMKLLGPAQLKQIAQATGQAESNTLKRLQAMANAGLAIRIVEAKKVLWKLPVGPARPEATEL